MKPHAAPNAIRKSLTRVGFDAAAVFAFFTFVYGGLAAAPLAAHPMTAIPVVGLASMPAPSTAIPAQTAEIAGVTLIAAKPSMSRVDREPHRNVEDWTVFGLAVSLIAALNLLMLRHIHRTYLVPVRRGAVPKQTTKDF